MKLALGVPSGDLVHADFAMSLATAIHHTRAQNNDIAIGIINQRSSLIQKGRHDTAVKAKKIGADMLLFIDSDMVFPKDAFLRLIAHKRRVAGCNYVRRTEPHTGLAIRTHKEGSDELIDESNERGTSYVDKIGFGFILLDMTVFDVIKPPYFRTYWDEDTEQFIGEDYDFCGRCGCKILCDHDLSKELGHIGMEEHKFTDWQEDK